MLLYSSQLLSVLINLSLSVLANASHMPKPPIYSVTSSGSAVFYSNTASSYSTISFASATNHSIALSKTFKHPHSKYSTGTAFYPTGTGVYPTSKHNLIPIGSVYSTTLISTEPSTTSSTVQSTTSTTPPTETPTSFKIQIIDPETYQFDRPDIIAPPIEGYYVSLIFGTPAAGEVYEDGSYVLYTASADASQASTFTLNADGTLQSGDLIAALPAYAGDHDFTFTTQAVITSEGQYKTICEIVDRDLLRCPTTPGSYYTDNILHSFSRNDGVYDGPYYISVQPVARTYDDNAFYFGFKVAPA